MKNNSHTPGFRFFKAPFEFNKSTPKETLQFCLGATLYMPGTQQITDKVLARSLDGLTSMVMCFEDALHDAEVPLAEDNVLNHLGKVSGAIQRGKLACDDVPLTFVRVRNLRQFRAFSSRLSAEQAEVLSGFVFPKFSSEDAPEYLHHLAELNSRFGCRLYGMPILEGRPIANLETREQEIQFLRSALHPFKEFILNIRVGATDFSSVFGVRRGINYSIYDILPVRDCLSDILNYFSRSDEGYTVSAPVWEYFLADRDEDFDHLLAGNLHSSLLNRNTIINPAIDGLLREVVLDIANGFVGKTIIHPSHLRFVNAMQAVTREEFEDASQILNTPGGVVKSSQANKMNEVNPHTNWARRVAKRAEAYGVIENESDYLKLFHRTRQPQRPH